MTPRTAPGPRGLPLLGNLFSFRRDVLRLLVESRSRFGDVVRFRLGPHVVHLVAHPDLVRQVVQERADSYDKETRSSVRIREMTGLGLLTANGESWRRERRLIQPAFRPAAVVGFEKHMTEATAAMLERWESHAGPIDVASEMMRLTYTIVGRTLFSAEVAPDADEVEHAMAVMLGHTYARLERIVAPPSWLPTPGNLRFRRALAAVDRVVYRILSERRRQETNAHDLLALLLRERDEETGTGLSDPQLRNETITLLLAGHETTANALAWTFYLLAKHPEEMERLNGEPEAIERAFKEAMRLYPPIWAMERRAVEEDELGGFHVPAGSTVVVSPWVTHRHPDLWEDPERFDPGRFTDERSEHRPPLAFIPFGAGPRFCVGAHFAMVEASIILSMVLRRWRLRLVPGHPVMPKPGITLRARYGVRVTLEPR